MFRDAYVRGGVLLGAVSAAGLFLLHPRLAVRDVDGYGYIVGARSLRDGLGYRSLTGDPLNHWPPGYSWVLSLFHEPLAAAQLVNYLSFGAATGLLYYLLRRSGWSWQAGLGLSVVLASGFLRLLATMVHAEALTYAVFLLALALALRGTGRTLGGTIWALLVPVKFIAVAFLPPALAAEVIAGRTLKGLTRRYLLPVVVFCLSAGGLLAFNAATTAEALPSSHRISTPSRMLVRGAREFIRTIPRTFLFNWHGPVQEPLPRAAFLLSMALAGVCLLSLRPVPGHAGSWLRAYAFFFLVCVAAMLAYRVFGPSARITGYGLIVLLLGFRPLKWANGLWLVYAGVALTAAVVNALTTPSLGLNDPRYVDLAGEVRAHYSESTIVATNAYRLLDLHAGIPSVPISTEAEARPYQKLLWVTMSNVDLTTAIAAMPRPGPEWCEERQFSAAVAFTRCEGDGGAQPPTP